MGKTTLLTIIGASVMIGKWPWSGEPIQFSHNMPRKIRYIGQDWEEHIKTVVEPEFRGVSNLMEAVRGRINLSRSYSIFLSD